jgi:hypothetical protein
MYTTIEVDFEVFKEITMRRESEDVTPNDVIRDALGLGPRKEGEDSDHPEKGQSPWVVKGVSFPHGTEFKASYKGKQHFGKVENGALVVDGIRHSSPSGAAVSITGNPVNGWRFWFCKFPGGERWRSMDRVRRGRDT